MDRELNLRVLAKHFNDEDKAREFVEAIRWPDRAACPRCGETRYAHRLQGKSTRPGLFRCGGCRKPFSVTIGTIFESSHIPLSKWLLAYQLLCISERGMSAHQFHKVLKITYRSAASMARRIRYTMTQEPLSSIYAAILEVEEKVRRDFPEPPARAVTILAAVKVTRDTTTKTIKLRFVLHPNGRLQRMTPGEIKSAEATEYIEGLMVSRRQRIAPNIEEVQGQENAFANGQHNLPSRRSPAQLEPSPQLKRSNRVTNSKPVPQIPIRFEQLIEDVLRMKAPAKKPATFTPVRQQK